MVSGDETFVTLGSDENAPPHLDEIVYKDDAGAICRCWNWREASRTMLTENTTNAFLCIESVDVDRDGEFHNAINELSEIIGSELGGNISIEILDINKKEIHF